ncbi:hypothetical protein [Methanolapillus ohkumae]|uniref:Uncharacterized protein n=1 Tax=Methanolapillus ohkumae TaxID=3028298 RepID=A0AA96V8K6_9EURY|nr:hypothetical protein MsAm2_16030 [Methanosarcinaceae archaeon Am2]
MKQKKFSMLPTASVLLVSGGNTQKESKTEITHNQTSNKQAPNNQTSNKQAPNKQAPNLFLAGEKYAMTHFDPGQSDAFAHNVPRGTFKIDLRKFPRIAGGPVNFMQMISTDPKYMWSTSTGGISYVDVSNDGWKPVAQINTPNLKVIPPEVLDKGLGQEIRNIKQAENIVLKDWGVNWSRLANNVYMFVDKTNVLYANAQPSHVHAYGLKDPKNPAAGIQILRTLDFSETLKKVAKGVNNPSLQKYGAPIIGLSMTYDGQIIILSPFSVSIIDREFKNKPQTIELPKDEFVSNSVCVDEKNAIYVASDKMMRKIVWTGKKLSVDEADGAWASPYDFGEEPPSVKFGTGTGSTPTLMGFGDDPDKLVVITDGANRMNLVAFWRDEIPADFKQQPKTKSRRIAGQIGITCGLVPLPKFIQSEQSVVVDGYGAFVVNNIRDEGHEDKLVDVLAGGPVFTPPIGVERCEWDPKTHSWKSVWTRDDVVGTSMVPSMSIPSKIVLVNGYTLGDGWELTGMDWNTGETVTRIIFGQDNLGNGAYALIQFLPNGDLLFNSIGGPVRVSFKK